MKISKFAFGAITAGMLLFASCSNDESIPEEQQNLVPAPTFNGTFAQMADVNPAPTTKSGVIEDNPDYADGEKFYWHDGDKVKVLFFPDGDINSTPVELIYTAIVADGKPNSCEFTTTGSVPAGNYKAYGLYPADSWSKDANGYKATSSPFIIQHDVSSTHLKDHMFMKASTGNITIAGEGSNSIDLGFEHLSSVVRFHITSDYETTAMKTASLSFFEKSGSDFFYTAAYLNSLDGTDLTPAAGSWSRSLVTVAMEYLDFTKKGSKWEIDFYLPVFPTVDTNGMKLQIESYIEVDGGNSYQQLFGTYYGLSFTNELSFMPNGFEAGKSYYFNLKAEIH